MNNKNIFFSLVLVFSLGLFFAPHNGTAQTQNTGNEHAVTETLPAKSDAEEEVVGKYKFIAPIEPLISGLVDPDTKLADLKDDNSLKNYVRAWFKFLVGVGGILAVIRLVHAGFGIITGASKAGAHSKVRDELVAIITSVLLIAGSWVFLFTINPSLVDSDLFVKTLSIEPYELMVQREPNTPGYWFKFKEISTGKIAYKGPYLHNKVSRLETTAARALVIAAYITPITSPFAIIGGASKAWDYDCSIDAGNYNVETITKTLPGTHSETRDDGMGGSYETEVPNTEEVKKYEVLEGEDPTEPGWCFFLPKGGKPGAYQQSAESEQANRNTLFSSGISVNKNPCISLEQRGCTSVGGLDPATIAHIQNLASQFGQGKCVDKKPGCPVIITGGSEPNGHVSHGDGSTFDINFNPIIETELQKNATYIAPGYAANLPRYFWNGYWYADEKNPDNSNHHFHVCKYRATGSNLHMCGPEWGPKGVNKLPLECVDAPGNTNQKLCRTRKTNVTCTAPLCGKAVWKDPKLMTETYTP